MSARQKTGGTEESRSGGLSEREGEHHRFRSETEPRNKIREPLTGGP